MKKWAMSSSGMLSVVLCVGVLVMAGVALSADQLAAVEPVPEKTVLTVPGRDDATLIVTCRLARVGGPLNLRMLFKTGKPVVVTIAAADFEMRHGPILSNGCFRVTMSDMARGRNKRLFGTRDERYFVRPKPHGERKKEMIEKWYDYPAATEHDLALRMEFSGGRIAFWIDDRFVAATKRDEPLASLEIRPGAGNIVNTVAWADLEPDRRYLPLHLTGYADRVGKLAVKDCSVAQGSKRIDQVPFFVLPAGEALDVGKSEWTGGFGYYPSYFSRSSFYNLPHAVMLSVPNEDFSYAHVICAVLPDKAKAPVLSLRLTRYLGKHGRGDAIADSAIDFEGKPEGSASRTRCGELTLVVDGKPVRLPLYHVALPLRSGTIQDVLDEEGEVGRCSTGYLDLELTRALKPLLTSNYSNYMKLPLGKPSAVRVLAVTLERSPVRVRVGSEQIGNIFYRAEKPKLNVRMSNASGKDFSGSLVCRIADHQGKAVEITQRFSVPAGTDEDNPRIVSVDVDRPGFGWYSADLTFRDANGRVFWEHPTSFVILPPDTRRAGAESPFATWWFRKAHLGTDDIDIAGPLFLRAGLRHTTPGRARQTEEDWKAYKLTALMLPWIREWGRDNEAAKKRFAQYVEAFPSTKWVMIFHETAFSKKKFFPPEFIGNKPPQYSAKENEKFQEIWDAALAAAKHYREAYPDLKLCVGNGTLQFVAELLRRGFPKEYVDAIGNEDLRHFRLPEGPPKAFKSVYWEKKYAEYYGYDVPVTHCYEGRGRTTRGELPLMRQAQLYVRDCLQGLAYRMPTLKVGTLYDTGNAYFYSNYGAGGLCTRYPLLNPKPSYAALATLTRMVDGAEFRRALPTDSLTLFALEFKKGDNMLYAFWIPRGERDVTLVFERDVDTSYTGMLGTQRTLESRDGKLMISVSASPCYIESDAPIKSVTAADTVLSARPSQAASVVDTLDSLDRWHVVSGVDTTLCTRIRSFNYPITSGVCRVSAPAAGKNDQGLRVELLPQPNVPEPFGRYVLLEAEEPIPLPGHPVTIGLWVDGNSCWGRVMWEIVDNAGRRFTAARGGWCTYDWHGRTYINFDGWNYVSIGLPDVYEDGSHTPDSVHWVQIDGPAGAVEYPIAVRRVILELRDTVYYLDTTRQVENRSVRVRDLTADYL